MADVNARLRSLNLAAWQDDLPPAVKLRFAVQRWHATPLVSGDESSYDAALDEPAPDDPAPDEPAPDNPAVVGPVDAAATDAARAETPAGLAPADAGTSSDGRPGWWAVPGLFGTEPDAAAVLDPRIERLHDVLDALGARPVSGRPVDVAALLSAAERARGLALAGLAELDVTRQYADAGAASAAGWLRRTQVIGDDTARATVKLAQRLTTELPELLQDLQQGCTTMEHVRAVAAGTSGLDPELVIESQPDLVDLAHAAEPATVRKQLRERAEAINPELGKDAARRQHARRGLYASTLGRYGVAFDGTLGDEDGSLFLHALDLSVQADRGQDDARTLPNRRADALVGWARDAVRRLAGPDDSLADDAHAVRTHLLVTCPVDQLSSLAEGGLPSLLGPRVFDPTDTGPTGPCAGTLTGAGHAADPLDVLSGDEPVEPAQLPTGAPLTADALRRLACDATLSLVVQQQLSAALAGHSSARPPRVEPLYVGRSARTVSGKQFKAIVVRDRCCVVRGCRRRPAQCEAHHALHWLDGGGSDLDNLVLLCHQHHHDHHDRGIALEHHDGRWMTRTGWSQAPP